MAYGKKGKLKVLQIRHEQFLRRDFDAEEWGYRWVKYGDIEVLRLEHDYDQEATDSFDFIEYSLPVSIEYEYDDH